jgi:CRISPR/Cas system-associated endonuclease Cas1
VRVTLKSSLKITYASNTIIIEIREEKNTKNTVKNTKVIVIKSNPNLNKLFVIEKPKQN